MPAQKKGPPPVDIRGRVFGRLTAVELDTTLSGRGLGSYWRCRCSCGKEAVVPWRALRRGNTRSCGCLRREVLAAGRHLPWKHLGSAGGRLEPLYKVWQGMRGRCLRPSDRQFPSYGGRGITIHPRWLSYENFRQDMEPTWRPGLTIDRIDNDGPYAPDNCRWTTMAVQARNKRNNVWLQTPEGVMLQEDALFFWSRRELARMPRAATPAAPAQTAAGATQDPRQGCGVGEAACGAPAARQEAAR